MIEGLLSIANDLLVLSKSKGLTVEEKNYIIDVVRKALEIVVLELRKETVQNPL